MSRGKQVGPKIVVTDQCAQSPETNTLDLGFNKSLDSRLPKVRSFDLDKFEQEILDAFDQYPSEKLDALYDMKQRVIDRMHYSLRSTRRQHIQTAPPLFS